MSESALDIISEGIKNSAKQHRKKQELAKKIVIMAEDIVPFSKKELELLDLVEELKGLVSRALPYGTGIQQELAESYLDSIITVRTKIVKAISGE